VEETTNLKFPFSITTNTKSTSILTLLKPAHKKEEHVKKILLEEKKPTIKKINTNL
jgi:hypothetical protein